MFVAEAKDLFDANGGNIEIIPIASAPERAQILQAVQTDDIVNKF